MRHLLLFLLVLFCMVMHGQPTTPGAAAAALGGSYVTQQSAVSARHNVAGIAGLQQHTIAAGIRNNYLANDLNDFYLLSTFKAGSGRLGIDLLYYGFDAWQQGEVGLSYARPLAANWFLGARVSYAYNYIPQERVSRHLVAADLGLLGILGKWRVGASLQQFAQSQWRGRVQERAPIVFRVGGGYYFSPQTSISAELFKADNSGADIRLGLAYAPADALALRFGFSTLQPSVAFGVGLFFNQIQVNIAAAWHQQLGLSPVIDGVYAW